MADHPLFPLHHTDVHSTVYERNLELEMLCIYTMQAIETAARELLFKPEERVIMDQAIEALRSNRDHYSKILRRLADHGQK
tara:strand:- start:2189 stop:2431 length:243 start_codon:yes stop_codon:yes gene_type:complete